MDGPAALIRADATDVAVDGGSWGAGRLTRPGSNGTWSWEPVPRTDFNLWHTSRWPSPDPADLRIRAIASLPWLTDSPLKIGIPGRRRLEDALGACDLARWAEALSARRGAQLPRHSWDWPTGPGTWQSDRSAHCRATVSAPGGIPALTAEVITQLPDGMYLSTVLGIAELRVNFEPWATALAAAGAARDAPAGLRLTLSELVSFYVVAWTTATLLAPLTAVESPLAMPPAGVPRVEFEFEVSPYHDSTPRTIGLNDVIDLSAFGPPTNDMHRQQGGFGITAPSTPQPGSARP
jgi:hypothetical protein